MPGPIPYRFERTHDAASIHRDHADIDAGTETSTIVSIAGRLMLRRVQGKLAFGTLQDSSGRIQLFAPADTTPDHGEFCALGLGDWIGVRGRVMKTRRGELSVKVEEWCLLAPAQRAFPDKWHGLTDVDTRFRQRYVDLWVTDEARFTFQLRSRMLSLMRRWLEARGFMEFETPVFHTTPGGAHARPFVTHHNALDLELHLRIALELHLKRLVVGGFERVFEIGRVFRNEGLSPRHNPEFTMLELYQAYADYGDIMELVEQLIAYLAFELRGTTVLSYGGRELDLTPPWRRATLLDLLEEHSGLRLSLDQPLDDLHAAARSVGVEPEPFWGPGTLILEIYEKTTEPHLWGPIFVLDYPTEVSPLARDHRTKTDFVERFEAIVAGRELCNAYSELNDAAIQRARFEAQAKEKAAGYDEAMSIDEDYLRAMEYGLPPTGGLGIGVDRLVMLLSDTTTIRDVILFPTLRPEVID